MMEQFAAASRAPGARITGVVYLLYFLTAVAAEAFIGRHRLVPYDAANLIADALYIAVTLRFYSLFAPVNRSLSLLAALFSLLGCANGVLGLFHVVPYKISSLVFYVLMMLAGVGWLIFLSPLADYLSTYLKVLGFLAEASLMLWLIVKGVNVARWKELENVWRLGTEHGQIRVRR
jgi:hypothetical protein